jgi:hypothetical protein
MARSRERGTGSVYLPEDPKNPGQKLQTWWISYYIDYIDGKRRRESSKSRKKSEAQALLKRRMGGARLGPGDRGRGEAAHLRGPRSGLPAELRALRRLEGARHHGNALESYAAQRRNEAAPATVQYELAVLRRAMSLAVKKGQLRSRPHFPHVGVHNARTGF